MKSKKEGKQDLEREANFINRSKRKKEREFMLVGKNAKTEKAIPEEYRKGQGRHSRCARNSTGNRRHCGGGRVRTEQARPRCLHRAWPHTTLLSKGPSRPVLPG